MRVVVICALATVACSAEPPPDLMKRVVARETLNEAARQHYMYRQTVTVEDLDRHGARLGQYREVRDIIFSPDGTRTEQAVEKASDTLKRLKITDEDLRDIREVQPVLITSENAFIYENKFRGEETLNGIACWVLQIRPRQILAGQRLFDGLIWVAQSEDSIVQLEGQAVPQIISTKSENLFPHFTTIRDKVGGNWFPVTTYGDDTLYFRTGPQRIRLIIRYANYRRFGAETNVEYQQVK